MHQESYAEVEYCSEGRKNYDLLELVLPCASCLADQWLSMIQSIKNESKEIYCNRIIRIITVNINRWITWNRYCTQGDWKQLDSLYIGLTPCYHNIFWSHECRTVITNVSNTPSQLSCFWLWIPSRNSFMKIWPIIIINLLINWCLKQEMWTDGISKFVSTTSACSPSSCTKMQMRSLTM